MDSISDVAVSMIVGKKDDLCHPERALNLAKTIPTMANFIKLEGVGHGVAGKLRSWIGILANELTDEKPTEMTITSVNLKKPVEIIGDPSENLEDCG